MTVDEIEEGGFYKIKTFQRIIVYHLVKIHPSRKWVEVVMYGDKGKWFGRKSMSLQEFASMIEVRVKPR